MYDSRTNAKSRGVHTLSLRAAARSSGAPCSDRHARFYRATALFRACPTAVLMLAATADTAPSPGLHLAAVEVRYGRQVAVSGIDLDVAPAEIHVLVASAVAVLVVTPQMCEHLGRDGDPPRSRWLVTPERDARGCESRRPRRRRP